VVCSSLLIVSFTSSRLPEVTGHGGFLSDITQNPDFAVATMRSCLCYREATTKCLIILLIQEDDQRFIDL